EAVRPTGGRRGGLAGALDRVRERAEAAVSRGLPAELGALARGMVLGQDDALSEDLREAMRASGLAHLVAASGQNVLLLSALVLGLCALGGVPLRARLSLAIALVVLYVPLAGAGPSIQRAGVMGVAGLLAALAGRPSSRWYAVLLAAALTLALDPRSAADPGWQLSFAAVLAMLALSRPLRKRLEARRLPGALAEALALTLAATIGTAPLLAAHFERLSLISIPANLLAVLAVGPVMWVGTLAAALGKLSPTLAAPVAAVATWPLGFLAWVGRACADLPLAEVEIGLPGPAGVAVTYAAIVVLACSVRARRATLAVALIAGAAMLPGLGGGPGPPRAVRISFLDVGQGDATLVQSPQGAAILFDGGPPGTDLVDDLRAAGVDRLDAVVATHQSLDHDGGLPAVMREFPVELFLDGGDDTSDPRFRALRGTVAARAIRSIPAAAGQTLRARGLIIRILSPSPRPPGPPPEDPNPRAVVAHVEGHGLDALLSGDAESPALLPLDLPEVDVLKVPHHGSADEGLPAVLKRLEPAVAAIPVGRNTYGHPTAETLAALGAGVRAVHRTDRDGTITVTATPRGPAVHTER
ncbi:MAG TPA: ComEC/Rec2 family competence protein, partial [Solirubrobacteraceae bacterium]|nr:ComEC/Rec2 family competence protein [Solirubrobacteraceae bacterium]